MTPATEKRLGKWLDTPKVRGPVRQLGLAHDGQAFLIYDGLEPYRGRTLNAAVRRFLDAAEGKDGKR